MGFFKSPLGSNKKKVKVVIDDVSNVSPKIEAADSKEQPSSASASASAKKGKSKSLQPLSLPPPLFSSETDRQLLKNLKGTGGTIRRLSLNSGGDAPVSVETAKKRLMLSKDGKVFLKAASVAVRPNRQKGNERFMASYGLSPFVGNKFSVSKALPKSNRAPLPTTLPLMDDDDDENDINEQKSISGIPPLPYNGSDSASSLQVATTTPNASFDERDTNETASKTPLSPAGAEGLHPKLNSTSPRQLQKPSSFRSPQQFNRPASFRIATSPKPSSLRSTSSPKQVQKASSFRSAPSADDESYVEELVLEEGENSYDEIEYYEEEIIEEEILMSPGNDGLCDDKPTTIKFDEYDEMQLTLNLDDYSDQELKKSWYKRKDYDEMIQEARQVALKEEERRNQFLSPKPSVSESAKERNPQLAPSIQQPLQHHVPHKSELEARGLEAWTPSGAIQVRKIKETAIEAVWDEQQRQWDTGIQDYDAMRQVYQKVSGTGLCRSTSVYS
ncbi:MAG: hypothetical protein SGARI_003645 [Bacillariaceae sp.]